MPNATVKSQDTKPKKRRRKPRGTRDETREQLIQAAIDLLRREGVGAVTTVSVTNAIGLTQSGFYLHFSSVEQCLEAAAQQCTQQLRQYVADHLQATQQDTADPMAAHVRHYQAMLDLCASDRVLGELFLKRRFDGSPIGQAMRDFHEGLRNDLANNLRELARALNPHSANDARIPILAELLLAMTISAAEMLVEGRATDSRQLADELAAYTFTMCDNLWQRIS